MAIMSDIERRTYSQIVQRTESDSERSPHGKVPLRTKIELFTNARKLIELRALADCHDEPTIAEECSLDEVTVIMPIAGRATRAREVTKDQIPKHLIKLRNGDTVLDTITQQLQYVGFRRFVFCVGFLKEQLIDHIQQGSWITNPNTSYALDETEKLLGPDGTVLHAIGALGLKGQAMLVPGDVMLPWDHLVDMNRRHVSTGADVTFGVTSHVTERTTDVGKIVVENGTDRLLWGYGRTEEAPPAYSGTRNLTSAPSHVISIERFVELCNTYREHHPERATEPLSLRDDMLSWIRSNGGFEVRAYDIEGETLDLGTPANIYYGQENWRKYVSERPLNQ